MSVNEDMRTRLLALVREQPGASTSTLGAALGIGQSTAGYHLKRLARSGQVQSTYLGRDRCWYATLCGLCPVLRRALPVVKRPEVLRIAATLDHTPRNAMELARRADMAPGTVRWATSALARTFLAERSRAGRTSLREGAEICLAKAAAGEPCDLWGRCAISDAWRKKQKDHLLAMLAREEPLGGLRTKSK